MRSTKAGLAAAYLFTSIVVIHLAAAQSPSSNPPAQPTPVIFDTDMYSDIDDALALAMLHTLQDRNEVKLLAITLSTDAKWIAPYVDRVDTYYGHSNIPIGAVQGGVTEKRYPSPAPYSPNGINYTQYLSQMKSAQGTLIYPHRLPDTTQTQDAVSLLRHTLATQPDQSVVVIQVGFSTNLAKLLDSKPDEASPLDGRSLVAKKVKLLSAMAGSFGTCEADGKKHPAGAPETNLLVDVPAAQTVFSHWPTPLVASGYEIGCQMRFSHTVFERYFGYTSHNPIADTYNYVAPYYRKASKHPEEPHDHATYDLTAVLYAARPDGGYFSLSEAGEINVQNDGASRFQPNAGGTRRYLIQSDTQRARTLEAMELLVTQPPTHSR